MYLLVLVLLLLLLVADRIFATNKMSMDFAFHIPRSVHTPYIRTTCPREPLKTDTQSRDSVTVEFVQTLLVTVIIFGICIEVHLVHTRRHSIAAAAAVTKHLIFCVKIRDVTCILDIVYLTVATFSLLHTKNKKKTSHNAKITTETRVMMMIMMWDGVGGGGSGVSLVLVM